MCFGQDSVPPLNGGAGGRYPQIRVLPPLGKLQLTSIYRLPLRARPQLTLTKAIQGMVDPQQKPDG
jgi:hypothetical protein